MPNIFEKFSKNLRRALVMSERIASEQKTSLDTEHQLSALIVQKGTLANDIVKMFEISTERSALVSDLVRKSKNPSVGITSGAKESIQLAVSYASKYNHSNVDCEHLLLALVTKKTFNSFNVIERMGVNPKDIKNQIESIFNEVGRTTQKEDSFVGGDEIPEIDMNDLPIDQPLGPFGPIPAPNTTKRKQKKETALEQFTSNLTKEAASKEIDPVIGREKELDRVTQILSRRKKNNPVLIGEPGVGKTAIVEGLAHRIVSGEVPHTISNKEILSLDMGSLLAGTMYRGQFESRLKNVMSEIKQKKNVLLFIDEIHTVIGTGSAEGSMDAANILKPNLVKGEISVIGATTLDEYKKNIEKDAAFERRFQPVLVSEPTEKETFEILKGIQKQYENHHKITYTDKAIAMAVKLSKRYIQDRYLPDKAIDLIDEAAAATKTVNKQTRETAKIKNDLKNISISKDKAVFEENYEVATQFRQKEILLKKKYDALINKLSVSKDSIITEENIANVVSRWTGVPVTTLTQSEKKKYLNLEERLSRYIVGQDEAIKSISQSIRRSRTGVADPKRPIGSFIFLGPTGVGKTELVKVLASELYGRDDSLIKIDMSEFMERHNVSRLIGAPAGYVGYEEGGRLTEQIRRNPYSVILFDEIEKAHPEVFNVLLQIMEDGELTDAKGRKVDFKNALLIMTSNLGTDILNKQAAIGFDSIKKDEEKLDDRYEKLKNNVLDSVEKHFRPEFINRVDKIIVFRPLHKKIITKIVEIEIKKLLVRTRELKIELAVTQKAKSWIAEKGYDPKFGARPMRKIIAENLEDKLSEAILAEKFEPDDKVGVIVLKDKLVLKKS